MSSGPQKTYSEILTETEGARRVILHACRSLSPDAKAEFLYTYVPYLPETINRALRRDAAPAAQQHSAAREITRARLAITDICEALTPRAKALWTSTGDLDFLAECLDADTGADDRPPASQGNVVPFPARLQRKKG